MRKLAVKERGIMSKVAESSIKQIPYLNDDTKYNIELCHWVFQIVYTRAFETEDGDLKIVPMGDVSVDALFYLLTYFMLLDKLE